MCYHSAWDLANGMVEPRVKPRKVPSFCYLLIATGEFVRVRASVRVVCLGVPRICLYSYEVQVYMYTYYLVPFDMYLVPSICAHVPESRCAERREERESSDLASDLASDPESCLNPKS